jgi:hypothetical protein
MESSATAAEPSEPPAPSEPPPLRFELKPELFPRSVQSLRRDGFAPIAVGLIPAILILSTWTVWVWAARLPIVVTSRTARVDAGVVVATFRNDERTERIHIGQIARVRVDGFPAARWGALDAVVNAVDRRADGTTEVQLTIASQGAAPMPVLRGLSGDVDVEVDRVSPLGLLLESAGRRVR